MSSLFLQQELCFPAWAVLRFDSKLLVQRQRDDVAADPKKDKNYLVGHLPYVRTLQGL